jgi:hypothetical protein
MTGHIALGNQSFLINLDKWFLPGKGHIFSPRGPGKSPYGACPADRSLY